MISPETLRRFSLFAGVDPATLKEIAMMGSEVTLQAEDWLFFEGEAANSLFFVIEGRIELTIKLDEKGERFSNLTTLVEGDLVGWTPLLDDATYTMGAYASVPSKAARISGTHLRAFLETHPEAGFQVMRQLVIIVGDRLTKLRTQFVSMLA